MYPAPGGAPPKAARRAALGGVWEPCFSQRKPPTASLKARLLGVTITNIIVNLSPGLTVKVQGQHSGSHMGAGDGLVTDGEYLAGAAGLPQGGGQVQRLRRGGEAPFTHKNTDNTFTE